MSASHSQLLTRNWTAIGMPSLPWERVHFHVHCAFCFSGMKL